MRAISTATISFGLVTIPVKLYTAKRPDRPAAKLRHASGAKLRQQYVRDDTGEPVERAEIRRAYPLTAGVVPASSPSAAGDGSEVLFHSDEIATIKHEALDPELWKTITIEQFVPLTSIDPAYFRSVTYLGPTEGGDRAYRLLRDVLRETGKAALGLHAFRGKLDLVLLRPLEHGLALHGLHRPDELRGMADVVTVSDKQSSERELAQARALVDFHSADEISPSVYDDLVTKRLRAAIAEKANAPSVRAKRTASPEVVDLAAALRASLFDADARNKPARRPPHRAAKPRNIRRASTKGRRTHGT
jgi:DNA end-binding protein Ku